MSTSLSPLLAPMLSSAAMRAVCDDVAYLQRMLDFEAALARAEAATGVIPAGAAGQIGSGLQGRAPSTWQSWPKQPRGPEISQYLWSRH